MVAGVGVIVVIMCGVNAGVGVVVSWSCGGDCCVVLLCGFDMVVGVGVLVVIVCGGDCVDDGCSPELEFWW
uniref:Transmembrane protein n=1 Tax=Fagus sylvatica TaxID=28930 RepID=A0A2N9IVX9_FAGSY